VRLRFSATSVFGSAALLLAGCSSTHSGDDAVESKPDAAETTQPDATIPDAGMDAPLEAQADDAAQADAGTMDAGDAGDCALDSQGEPTELRCTGLYSDWAMRTISSSVKEYDPGLRLWSDGAQKTRWMYLPPNTQIDTSDMDEWQFPVGTKFWKQFVLNGAYVETRFIHKRPQGWFLTTYQWSADGSTATELTTGMHNVNDAGYEIPSQPLCSECHKGRQDFVLGFEAVSLSSPLASGLGVANQSPMKTLAQEGLLTDLPDAGLQVPGTPVEAAALGYLHANCGTTCHNAGNGAAVNTHFYMRLNVGQLGSVGATDTYQTGVGVPTSNFNQVTERVDLCNVANSCVFYRMSRRDGENGVLNGTQMPPVDSHRVDVDGGVPAIAAWINEGCDAGGAGDSGADAQH
jgi:hypothetical protein